MRNLFFFLVASAVLCSCSSSKNFKNMVYLTDSISQSQRVVSVQEESKIQPGDRLEIAITALNPQAAMVYNMLPAITQDATTGAPAKGGYLVDQTGNIQFPQLGNIAVSNLTRLEIAEKIKVELAKYIKEPSVSVNIINFKINVLGEVSRPGSILVPDGKITILEALGESGDLTIYGRRENILIIREKDGKREFGRIDLTSNQVFTSPYFNLRQGDVVYVEMKKNKAIVSDAEANNNFRLASLVLTAITAIAVVINVLK